MNVSSFFVIVYALMFKDKIVSSPIGRGGLITWIMTSIAHSGFRIPLHLIQKRKFMCKRKIFKKNNKNNMFFRILREFHNDLKLFGCCCCYSQKLSMSSLSGVVYLILTRAREIFTKPFRLPLVQLSSYVFPRLK